MKKDHFNGNNARKFDNQERVEELRPDQLLRDVVGIKQGMVCIDMGSGTGTFSFPMSKLVGGKGTVFAIDNSQVMLNHLRRKNPPPNLQAIHASVYETGIGNNMVDFCLLSFILHEVKEPIKLLREAFRLLKNNGRVCVIEWKAELTPHGPPRNIRITREHLKELFNESGLTHFKYINWSTNHYVAIGEK